MNKLSLWFHSYRTECKKALIGIGIGIICLALVVLAVWLFSGPLSGNTKVNWQMNGTLVTSDGTVIETMELSIVGKIHKDPNKRDILTLDITLPDDFPYSFKGRDIPEFYSSSDEIDEFPYYVCSGYTYDKSENAPVLCSFALDEERGWAIFCWPNQPEQYLVCSTTADVNADEIITHFQAFLDSVNPK